MFPAWFAQLGAVLLHHRVQDVLARADTQLEIRPFDGLETGGLPGMLRHGGGSFLVSHPLRITRRVKKPPLLHQKINRPWDIPI